MGCVVSSIPSQKRVISISGGHIFQLPKLESGKNAKEVEIGKKSVEKAKITPTQCINAGKKGTRRAPIIWNPSIRPSDSLNNSLKPTTAGNPVRQREERDGTGGGRDSDRSERTKCSICSNVSIKRQLLGQKAKDRENSSSRETSQSGTRDRIRKLLCLGDGHSEAELDQSLLFFGSVMSTPPPSRIASQRSNPLQKFSIDTSRAKSNSPVVSFCARKLSIQEYSAPREDGKPCDIYWHSVVHLDMKSVVREGARVNKFPGMTELAKKISLTQAIRSMKQLFPREYAFYPQSWILPAQLSEFKEYCAQSQSAAENGGKCFIVKPDDGAQGTGIYLVNSVDELQSDSIRQLIQEYVPDPYLLPDRLKFDLRVYALIKSINPLSIYVAREGMARFCTEKYPERPSPENFGNLFAHLTNYSLNKANNAYVHSKSLREQLKGSKRLLSTVFHQMEHKGVRTRRLWTEIKMIIVKTVLAMVPEIMLNYEHHFGELRGMAPQCFQIMGFDILVRKDGCPVLLEVNSSPSLSVEHYLVANIDGFDSSQSGNEGYDIPSVRSIVDEMIKVPLVRDSLLLVLDQLEHYYPRKLPEPINSARKTRNSVEDGNVKPKWDVQSMDSMGTNLTNGSIMSTDRKGTEDDLGLLRRAKRPHLSEVFPARYGQGSRHLLVLDRVVYLFLQFVAIKQTLLISLPAVKTFLRKCELGGILSNNQLEAKFAQMSAYFGSEKMTGASGGVPALPFHGFLQILFLVANLKFPHSEMEGLMPSLLQLLSHCDSALRRYGVRSTRLRHTEMTENCNERKSEEKKSTPNGGGKEKPAVVKIYLLPNRMSRPSLPTELPKNMKGPFGIQANGRRIVKANRARSLPRPL